MDEDAPIQKRWRLLAWAIAAVILLPVLYVAAAGPAAWWSFHHYRGPEWMDAHARSLNPLYQHPQTRAALDRYLRWWFSLPAPRSWQRAKIVAEIADLREARDYARTEQPGPEAEAESVQLRLDAIDTLPSPTQAELAETIILRRRLQEIDDILGGERVHIRLPYVSRRAVLETRLREAEERLREFDSQ